MNIKLKKDYLKIEEIGNITNQCADPKLYSYEREIIKVVLVAKYCVDEDFGDKADCDIYNELAEKCFTAETYWQIKNVDVLENCIAQDLSLAKAFSDFFNHISDKIDEFGNKLNSKDFMAQMETILKQNAN
jgi:hypothetical protein